MTLTFTTPPPLGIPVEIMGITGDLNSGKTILALSIAPGKFGGDSPHAGKARTLYLDFEKSGGTFGGAGAERVDVPTQMRAAFGDRAYSPVDVFHWFRAYVLSVPAGRYDVIAADPVTDVEDGLTDYVSANPKEFGYTESQFASANALKWGVVKSLWKSILVDIAARCQMFIFTTHMRQEFRGGRPTGKVIPKGKETLAELASLYLQLEREKPELGQKPKPPSAIVLKERLSVLEMNEKTGNLDVLKILPERLPEATPAAIRYYIANPIGKRKLKPEELVQEPTLTDDQKRWMELELEQARAAAAQAELAKLEMAKTAAIENAKRGIVSISAQLLMEIKQLSNDLFKGPEESLAAFQQATGLKGLGELDEAKGNAYKSHLIQLKAARKLEASGTQPDAATPTPVVPDPPDAAAEPKTEVFDPQAVVGKPLSTAPLNTTEPMRPEEAEQLAAWLKSGIMPIELQRPWLEKFKVTRFREINRAQFQELMASILAEPGPVEKAGGIERTNP